MHMSSRIRPSALEPSLDPPLVHTLFPDVSFSVLDILSVPPNYDERVTVAGKAK